MCRLIVLMLMFYASFVFSQYTFTSLIGFEDANGNTRLIYRFGANNDVYNSVSEFNTATTQSSVLVDAYRYNYPSGAIYKSVECVAFWGKNPSRYIYGGDWVEPDNHPYIRRFDGATSYTGNVPLNIIISPQNDSILYACTADRTVKSTDGGRNWGSFINTYSLLAVSQFNQNLFFASVNGQLARSEDGGNTFTLVDTNRADIFPALFFDKDRQHIYRLRKNEAQYTITVSANAGQPYSWNAVASSAKQLYLTIDDSASGTFYYASGRKIFKAAGYGQTIALFDSLNYNITGLYCKPGTDILYASTGYFIYKIIQGNHSIVFSRIPLDFKEWYPLNAGNRKIYSGDFEESSPPFPLQWTPFTLVEEYLKDSLLASGKKYSLIVSTKYQSGSRNTSYSFQRLDTLTGKVYKLANPAVNPDSEVVFEDLLARPGDEFYAERYPYHYHNAIAVSFLSEDTLTILNTFTLTRSFKYLLPLESYQYKLARQFGMLSYYRGFDFGHESIMLKGMVRNGIVYGDTTLLVSVSNETSGLPGRFELMQNYPNPFNPVTTIRFNIAEYVHVSLNIYNQLGELVDRLADGNFTAGIHEIRWNAERNATGVYVCELKTPAGAQYGKLILLK